MHAAAHARGSPCTPRGPRDLSDAARSYMRAAKLCGDGGNVQERAGCVRDARSCLEALQSLQPASPSPAARGRRSAGFIPPAHKLASPHRLASPELQRPCTR
jgi:hypothetical protein